MSCCVYTITIEWLCKQWSTTTTTAKRLLTKWIEYFIQLNPDRILAIRIDIPSAFKFTWSIRSEWREHLFFSKKSTEICSALFVAQADDIFCGTSEKLCCFVFHLYSSKSQAYHVVHIFCTHFLLVNTFAIALLHMDDTNDCKRIIAPCTISCGSCRFESARTGMI